MTNYNIKQLKKQLSKQEIKIKEQENKLKENKLREEKGKFKEKGIPFLYIVIKITILEKKRKQTDEKNPKEKKAKN